MLKSYLRVAWRSFAKNKVSSFINILGFRWAWLWPYSMASGYGMNIPIINTISTKTGSDR